MRPAALRRGVPRGVPGCLAGLGVQALQGYLTGRPMGAQALQQVVGRRSDTPTSSYDAMI